jgi:hypothetical protein
MTNIPYVGINCKREIWPLGIEHGCSCRCGGLLSRSRPNRHLGADTYRTNASSPARGFVRNPQFPAPRDTAGVLRQQLSESCLLFSEGLRRSNPPTLRIRPKVPGQLTKASLSCRRAAVWVGGWVAVRRLITIGLRGGQRSTGRKRPGAEAIDILELPAGCNVGCDMARRPGVAGKSDARWCCWLRWIHTHQENSPPHADVSTTLRLNPGRRTSSRTGTLYSQGVTSLLPAAVGCWISGAVASLKPSHLPEERAVGAWGGRRPPQAPMG